MKYHRYYDRDIYQSFLDVCEQEELDRAYVDDFLQREIITDYIMTNTDRHLRNIAILRDPDTPEVPELGK